jgi:uncharacterized protein YecE (DUF72 family)
VRENPIPKVNQPTPTERDQRKARREERRAKQRIENISRAKKMHIARLMREYPRFQIPAEQSLRVQPTFHIGCSGWFYWHWRDSFYPTGLPSRQWFAHYASKFTTVELNAPFYSWPTLNTVKTWVKNAGRRKFVYSVKVCELITHTKRFKGTKTLIRDFGLIADILGPRMGCFLFQLPPSFHYTRGGLDRLVSQLDCTRKNVVEFRHRSWWNKQVFKTFSKRGIIFCSCSGPRLPDELIQTADDIYIRFHGIKHWYRHDYSKEELAIWANRILNSRAKTVWAYFNNDRNLFAIKNARGLRTLLKNPR